MVNVGSRSGRVPNEIVEADELAIQYSAAGGNSYRSSIVRVLDGLAARASSGWGTGCCAIR
jgi:hypothetical protein